MKKTATLFLILCLLLMLGAPFNASAEANEVSKGASYTLLTPASEGYPDDGKKLTDGVHGTHKEGLDGYYAGGDYVGFNKAQLNDDGNFVILLDLGKVYSNLSEFTLGYLNETAVGITAPASVSFSVSEDRNGVYNKVGEAETTPSNPDVSATYAKTVTAKAVSGRFVRVEIKPFGYTDDAGSYVSVPWTFIDEITIRTNGSADSESDASSPTQDQTPDTPQMGDGTVIFAFVLLALASLAMMLALFSFKKNREF